MPRSLHAALLMTARWLQQVTDFFVAVGGIQNPVPATRYFDPAIYLENVKA